MRVSPVGWWARSWEECLELAEESASVTHNHPEGIKGAQAAAGAVYLARTGASRKEIRARLARATGYDLSRSHEAIKADYAPDVTCQGSVPESIVCYLECDSWEDAVRRAVALNGDTDTMAAMAGGIAEAEFGPLAEAHQREALARLDDDQIAVLEEFERALTER
jgi:ADP-ribosylglycohydrolase